MLGEPETQTGALRPPLTDGAVRSLDRGYFRITGRIDDVLDVSGHRMGTMEIESALVAHSALVAEAAVVGRPDDTTGEAICAFVVLKRALPNTEEGKAIAKQLRDHIAKEIGPIAKPIDVRFGDNLPKTRSGKIMRRILKEMAATTAVIVSTHILEEVGELCTRVIVIAKGEVRCDESREKFLARGADLNAVFRQLTA